MIALAKISLLEDWLDIGLAVAYEMAKQQWES